MGGRGSGRRKEPSRLFKDAIERIDDHEIIESLMSWAKGREVVCPHCNEHTGAFTADTVALQSAIELLNRKRGKVPQNLQVDVTERIELSADQIDVLIEKHLPALAVLVAERYHLALPEPIEGEYKEV